MNITYVVFFKDKKCTVTAPDPIKAIILAEEKYGMKAVDCIQQEECSVGSLEEK